MDSAGGDRLPGGGPVSGGLEGDYSPQSLGVGDTEKKQAKKKRDVTGEQQSVCVCNLTNIILCRPTYVYFILCVSMSVKRLGKDIMILRYDVVCVW